MADVQHNTMTGADLHEPKGAGAASANTVYVANGSGTGTWQKISTSEIDATFNNSNLVALNLHHDDLSTATSHFVVAPIAGAITKIYSVIDRNLAGSDTVLSFEIGGVAVTGGDITITQSGSAAGDVDSSTPSAANVVAAGQAIEVISDGGTSTGTAHAHITILMDVS